MRYEMKKISFLICLVCTMFFLCGCTKQVVFLDKDLNTTKQEFDKFVSTTGYSYRLKDDTNNIYNVSLGEYNYQYLLQSKPMFSYNMGFTCKFKALGNDTLMDCKTYPGNQGIWDIKRHLKEQKWENVQFVSYKKYKKMKNLDNR